MGAGLQRDGDYTGNNVARELLATGRWSPGVRIVEGR